MNTTKTNPHNDRVKRDYLIWLCEAKQRSVATVEQARHAIDRLEIYTGFKDFGSFNKEQALGFKHALQATKAQRSEKQISIATVKAVLQAVREFLGWLQGQQDYRRRITTADIAYLNLTTGEERQAQVTTPKRSASLEQYRTALFAMPIETELQRRDRALMAMLLVTCMRDAAVVSLKVKHLDIEQRHVFQDPRQVNTKFRKTINTFFFPVGDDIAAIVVDWWRYLTAEKSFARDDPLFPKTLNGHDQHMNFAPVGLSREHWADAAPVRKIFKTAFERVGLPYVHPHSIRDTLTKFAYSLNLSPEQLKAWSQNMGHDHVLTTLNCYGQVTVERQSELIRQIAAASVAANPPDDMAQDIAERVHALLRKDASSI